MHSIERVVVSDDDYEFITTVGNGLDPAIVPIASIELMVVRVLQSLIACLLVT